MGSIQSLSLKWVKNVKRDDGTDLAYFDAGMDREFNLNFSEAQKKADEHLQDGDVILLFQRIDKVKGIKAKTYLTHLVTPIDDEMLYNPDNPQFPYERRVAVIAKADPRTTQAIFSTPSILSFHKPNWGKLCPITLLHSEWSEDKVVNTVWEYFKDVIVTGYREYIIEAKTQLGNISIEEFNALEGREKEVLRQHIVRERNPELIRRAKAAALLQGKGKIICECCDFEFSGLYGTHRTGFIECHHKTHIAIGGERMTKLEDLAMVCANCHRMLHRRKTDGDYFSIDELKKLINLNK